MARRGKRLIKAPTGRPTGEATPYKGPIALAPGANESKPRRSNGFVRTPPYLSQALPPQRELLAGRAQERLLAPTCRGPQTAPVVDP
jgi:hypothetical protein